MGVGAAQGAQDHLGPHKPARAHRPPRRGVGHVPPRHGPAFHRVVRLRRVRPPRPPHHLLRGAPRPRELRRAFPTHIPPNTSRPPRAFPLTLPLPASAPGGATPRELPHAPTATPRHPHPVHGSHLRRGLLACAPLQRRHHLLRHRPRVLRGVRHLQLLHLLHRVPPGVLQPGPRADRRAQTPAQSRVAHLRVPRHAEDGRALPPSVSPRRHCVRRRSAAHHRARLRRRGQRGVRRRANHQLLGRLPVPRPRQQRLASVGDVLPDFVLPRDVRGARAHPPVLQVSHRQSRRVRLLLARPSHPPRRQV